jgi:hypothetical protein
MQKVMHYEQQLADAILRTCHWAQVLKMGATSCSERENYCLSGNVHVADKYDLSEECYWSPTR